MERYDSYKDSGVEWIGEIPSHWGNPKLKHMITHSFGGEVIDKSFWGEGSEVLYTTSKKIHKSNYEGFNESRKTTERDLLLSRNGDGVVHVPPQGCIYTNVVQLIRIVEFTSRRFLWYSLTHQIKPLNSFSDGDFIVSLNKEQWFNLNTPIPPLYEQERIVEYLDRKTALIDSLIEKTVRKIELLREKRTALINHVVTKGLNPDVEMKDSGVEWIGEIPGHWGVSKLKYSSQVLPSNVDKHILSDEIQVRLCNYTDVYYNEKIDDSIEFKAGSCTELEFKKFLIVKGDVIVTKDSESTDDIGIPTLVTSDFKDVVCGYHLTLFRPYRIDGGYLFRFIQSTGTRRYCEVNSNGITRFSLGKSTLEDLLHPTPPLHEQERIVEFLDEQTSIIDSTIATEERRIELLKEYRQSLISEVVTGKVKVTP
jgi:type I restriction enzyme S subunit